MDSEESKQNESKSDVLIFTEVEKEHAKLVSLQKEIERDILKLSEIKTLPRAQEYAMSMSKHLDEAVQIADIIIEELVQEIDKKEEERRVQTAKKLELFEKVKTENKKEIEMIQSEFVKHLKDMFEKNIDLAQNEQTAGNAFSLQIKKSKFCRDKRFQKKIDSMCVNIKNIKEIIKEDHEHKNKAIERKLKEKQSKLEKRKEEYRDSVSVFNHLLNTLDEKLREQHLYEGLIENGKRKKQYYEEQIKNMTSMLKKYEREVKYFAGCKCQLSRTTKNLEDNLKLCTAKNEERLRSMVFICNQVMNKLRKLKKDGKEIHHLYAMIENMKSKKSASLSSNCERTYRVNNSLNAG